MGDEQTKKGRGCFFYGCLTLVIVLLLGTVAVVLGVRYAINKVVTRYTDSAPMKIPAVQTSAAEVKALQERFTAFKQAVESGKPVEPLVLSEHELNALITGDANLSQFKDALYVSLAGDKVKGQISLPLERFVGWRRLHGRYLNGSATFKVSLDNGVLLVTLQSLQVKGQEVPDHIMAQLRAQNLAKDVYRDPQSAAAVAKLQSIEVKDGVVTVKARASQ